MGRWSIPPKIRNLNEAKASSAQPPTYDCPSRNVDRPKLEARDGVPDEMTDATAQMKEESEGAAERHDLADPGFDHALNNAIAPGTSNGRAQPDHQAHGAEAQN